MFRRFACQDCMVFQTRLGYRKKISGPICRTGEGRIYIKVVIILFNAFLKRRGYSELGKFPGCNGLGLGVWVRWPRIRR